MDMEFEEFNDENELSELFSDILQTNGVYMERINIIRSKCLLREKISKEFYGCIYIFCGSKLAEGTDLLGSDLDLMIVEPQYLAINVDSNFFDEKLNIFTMLLDDCSPGYTRLRVHRLNQQKLLQSSIIKEDGISRFLSSEEFLKIRLSEKIENFQYDLKNVQSHGPCKTTVIWNKSCDFTTGIECHLWPVAALNWIKRPRCKGWPSQRIIEKIASFPVHVVPVGDHRSSNSSIQWRFSFNYAERELFWNFNDTQIKCYVLLKSVFKRKLEDFSPEKLSGYQVKNLIFWISEEYGQTIFTKRNLLHCLKICLINYKDRIFEGFLPHYFLEGRNLLADTLEFNTRQKIQNEISNILENLFDVLLESCDLIYGSHKFLNLYIGSKRCFKWIVKTLLPNTLQICPISLKFEWYMEFYQIFASLAYSTIPLHPSKLNNLICDIQYRTNLPDNILPYMLNTAKSFCFLQLGMLLCQGINVNEPQEDDIDFANYLFQKGKDFDDLSGTLYLVTFALFINDIEKAWSLLLPVLIRCKPFIYAGRSSGMSLEMLQFSNTFISFIPFELVRNEDPSYCYEIVFPKYFVNFAPEPIKYELYLQQCVNETSFSCMYDPVVYAFYLMFEITRKKDGQMSAKDEILKLSRFIKERKSDLELYRAYNLLGFCYNKCGQTEKAFSAYCQSMQKKKKYQHTNVAVYHLCIIFLKIYVERGLI